jgi:hypothetical protein
VNRSCFRRCVLYYAVSMVIIYIWVQLTSWEILNYVDKFVITTQALMPMMMCVSVLYFYFKCTINAVMALRVVCFFVYFFVFLLVWYFGWGITIYLIGNIAVSIGIDNVLNNSQVFLSDFLPNVMLPITLSVIGYGVLRFGILRGHPQ